jgi:hypothetical protein
MTDTKKGRFNPDFIFEEGQENFADLLKINSLLKYSPDDPQALVRVLSELYQSYRVNNLYFAPKIQFFEGISIPVVLYILRPLTS